MHHFKRYEYNPLAAPQSKYKPIKFTCKQRDPLLTDLLQCMAAAYAVGKCAIATKVLGLPSDFPAQMLLDGAWAPTTLRLSAYGLSAVKPQLGDIVWRLNYTHLSTPGVTVLANPGTAPKQPQQQPSGASPAQAPADECPSGAFALFSKFETTPRLFACPHRDNLVTTMHSLALTKLGVALEIDKRAALTVTQLQEAVSEAERSHAADPSNAPIGQWQVRVEQRCALL